jgi:hypothetical protein
VHADKRAYNFKMAELFCADVHEQIFAAGIFTVKTLDGVLHGGRELTVRAAELFQQHIAEPWVWCSNLHGVHQFFYMVIHTDEIPSVIGHSVYFSNGVFKGGDGPEQRAPALRWTSFV